MIMNRPEMTEGLPAHAGLYPAEVLYRYPRKETVLMGIIGGATVNFDTWWEMLRFLWAYQVSQDMGEVVAPLFGFWN